MLTIPLKIKKTDNDMLLLSFTQQYTGLLYKLYNNAELLKDKGTKQELLQQYPLFDISMLDFCISEVRMKLSQHKTNKKNKEQQINDITKQLEENEFISKYEKRSKFKLIKKLSFLKRTAENDICFGKKALLRLVTKYSQEIQCIDKKLLKETDEKEIVKLNDERIVKEELLSRTKSEYQSNRNLGVYLVGRACDKGNRKIDFDLKSNKIIFKPNSKTHIEIEFYGQGKKRQKLLKKLQIMSEQRIMPLTVKLYKDEVHISYDEMLLNGFAFNDTECKKEQKVCKDDIEKKEVYKKHKKEQTDRMLVGKIGNRYMAVDLNPCEIGLCIGDKLPNGNIKFIYKEYISLEKLLVKLDVSSDDKKQVKQNNKRKHEIKEIWKYIFGLAVHYKCTYFVCEELEFKNNKLDSREGNRKVKNMWHLTLTKQLITKWCNTIGMIKIEVNPAYSSFIGNMLHNDIDCIAASKEILRRGMFKFIKGSSLYPDILGIADEKLTYLHQENININGITWPAMFKLFTSAKLRYRNKDKKLFSSLSGNNLNSHKSKIIRRFSSCNSVYVCS